MTGFGGVREIYSTFEGCRELNGVDASGFDDTRCVFVERSLL